MAPRIVLYDIETVFNVVATFRLMNQDPIPHRNILQERYVVSVAWKELHERSVHAVSLLDFPKTFKKDVHDDYKVLETFREVMEKADVLVAHNGDHYDVRFLETRMLLKGFSPLPPIPTIDTLKVAKGRFLFNSNRLDYLAQALGIGHKTPTEEDLWLKVLNGDEQAIRQMVKYNKGDVRLLESIFKKLQPFVPNHINAHLFNSTDPEACPRCQSTHVQKRGFHYGPTLKYQQFQCMDCGGWFRSRKALKPTPYVRVL